MTHVPICFSCRWPLCVLRRVTENRSCLNLTRSFSVVIFQLDTVNLRHMRGFEHIKASVTHLVAHHSLKNLKVSRAKASYADDQRVSIAVLL